MDSLATTSSLFIWLFINFLELSATTVTNLPDLQQVHALIVSYSPNFYFHGEEKYFPSNVDWYFDNGVQLIKNGDESNPIQIEPQGRNLPEGRTTDTYSMTLPSDRSRRNHILKGELESVCPYIHVKPVFDGLYTDIAIWVFYPFNGPVTAKAGDIIFPVPLGTHTGDWEHVTLHINNTSGELDSIYLAQHGSGERVKAADLLWDDYHKSPMVFVSKDGHAAYATPGEHPRPYKDDAGLVDLTAESDMMLVTRDAYVILEVTHLGITSYTEPWMNYMGKWGPDKDSPDGPKSDRSWDNEE